MFVQMRAPQLHSQSCATVQSHCVSVICVCSVSKVCETYPRDLYVPITASKPIIVGSSKFRSKGRFPVLTYFYQEKKVRLGVFLPLFKIKL